MQVLTTAPSPLSPQVTNLEVEVRSVRARNDAPAPAASVPQVENKEEKAKDQAERAELRKRVMELEKAMEAQKQMHAQAQASLEAQAERRVAAARGEAIAAAAAEQSAVAAKLAAAERTLAAAEKKAAAAEAAAKTAAAASEAGGGRPQWATSSSTASARGRSPARPESTAERLERESEEAKSQAGAKVQAEVAAKVQAAKAARQAAEAEAEEKEAMAAAEKMRRDADERAAKAEAAAAERQAKAEAAEKKAAEKKAADKAAADKAAADKAAAAEAKKAELAAAATRAADRAAADKAAADKAAADMAAADKAAAAKAAADKAAADKVAADKAAAAKPKPETKPEAEPAGGGISAKTLAKIGGAGTGKTVGPSGSFAWSGKDGSVHCAYASCTHIGGTGPAEGGPNHSSPSKKNQDAYFCAQLSDDTVVWGVLDGHGPDNGGLVAERASAALIEWFESHVDELKPEKAQSAMKRAFEHAHSVVREAIVRKYTELGTPLRTTSEGFLVDSTNLPIDGGTTVTVVALLQGHLLVVANVGDSDCLLGGVLADGTIGFEQLCADHTPMSVEEYVRVARLTESRGEDWEPANFVYDADNSNDVLEIFAVSEEGQVQVDKELQGRLDDLGVGYKTTRGDRPTALVVPETSKYGMQRLGMTRSLGDFYMQYHGCTFEPEVSCIDLFDLVTQLKHVTVIVASDGLWDIWAYKDVLKEPLKATESSGGSGLLQPAKVQATLDALVEETRKETAEMFGDSADNISAVCISFDSIAPKT
jgi:serine/threonine protein phosphatase PrpC